MLPLILAPIDFIHWYVLTVTFIFIFVLWNLTGVEQDDEIYCLECGSQLFKPTDFYITNGNIECLECGWIGHKGILYDECY